MFTTKYRSLFVLLILSLFVLTGCYWNEQVEPSQMGVQTDGGRIIGVVGPGVYTNMGFFDDLTSVNVSTLTFSVEDPEVATKDSQLVGVKITIQARRKNSNEAIISLMTNWNALKDDDVLMSTVSATAREGIKVGTRSFNLEELLNDRNKLADAISEALKGDASKYSVDIINVTIENVALDPEYAKILQSKALLTAQIEQAVRQQDLIKQQASNDQLTQIQRQTVLVKQLEAEKAETDVQVEIASRAGKKIAAENQVYVDNEQAYTLKQLEWYSKILGDKSTFYFLDPQQKITMLFNRDSTTQLVPIGPEPESVPVP